VRHALVRVVEALQVAWNQTETWYSRVLFGAFEQRLESYAYTHERLAGPDVLANWLDIACAGELGEAVTEVTYPGDYEFLKACPSVQPLHGTS